MKDLTKLTTDELLKFNWEDYYLHVAFYTDNMTEAEKELVRRSRLYDEDRNGDTNVGYTFNPMKQKFKIHGKQDGEE